MSEAKRYLRNLIDEHARLQAENAELRARVPHQTQADLSQLSQEEKRERRRQQWRAYYYRNRDERIAAVAEYKRRRRKAAA